MVGAGEMSREMDGVTKRSWRRGLRDCCHRRLRIRLEKVLFKSIQESIMLFCRDAEENYILTCSRGNVRPAAFVNSSP